MLGYPSKLNFYRVVLIKSLVLSTAIGLQSCSALQSLQPNNTKKSAKPPAQANQTITEPRVASPLPKGLPTAAFNKRANPGQSSVGGGQPGAIDPVTGLPIPVTGAGTTDPVTGLPIPVKGANPSDPTGQASPDALARMTTLPPGKTNATTVPLPKTSPLDLSGSSGSGIKNSAKASASPTKVTTSRNKAQSQPARAKGPDVSAMYRQPSNGLPLLKPSVSPNSFEPSSRATGSSATLPKSRTNTFNNTTGNPTGGTFPNATDSNSPGTPTTTGSTASGNNGQASASSGYVYDPATAAYRPASSLPVWNPSANHGNTSTPTSSPSP